jgi:hypothetical protein
VQVERLTLSSLRGGELDLSRFTGDLERETDIADLERDLARAILG